MENPKPSVEIQAQLKRLHEVVARLLSSRGDDTSQKLLLFIRRTLRQFHLDHQFHESEIVVEAYLRTHKRIEAGSRIENIPGWLNQVSLNIIREYSRKGKKSQALQIQLIDNTHHYTVSKDTSSEFLDSQKIDALLTALAQLKPEDEEILILRNIKGLSWQEISEYLEAKDLEVGKKHPVQNLRKRGERALARLKQKFFSVDQAPSS